MVVGEGAGVGEEVSSDVVREYQSLSSDRLETIKGQGLSDQRVALINRIIAERQAGVQTSEQQLVSAFAEQRGVPQKAIIISRAKAERLGVPEEQRKSLTRDELTRFEVQSGQYDVRGGRTFIKPEVRQQIQEQQRGEGAFLERRITGSFIRNGKEITTTKLFYVNPNTNEERLATAKERKSFREQTREVEAKTKEEVQAERKPFFTLTGASQRVGETKRGLERGEKVGLTGIRTGAIGLGLGLATSGIGTLQFGKSLILHPITTLKSTYYSGKSVIKGDIKIGKLIGGSLKRDPSFTLGFIGGELLTLKGMGMVTGKLSRPILSKIKKPKTESIVSLSLETKKGKTTGALIGFQTSSGRMGTISQLGKIGKGKIQKTMAGGEIYTPKFTLAGGVKKTKVQQFAGQIISKSARGEASRVALDIKGLKITKPSMIEGIFGKGRVAISPREKFFRLRYGLRYGLKKKVRGIKIVGFESKTYALNLGKTTIKDVGLVRAKFFLGGTRATKGKPSGFAGFSFQKIPTIKTTKGFAIQKPTKAFQILSPQQQKALTLRQAGLLSIASTTAQATARVKLLKIKSPVPKLITKQEPTKSVTKLPVTTPKVEIKQVLVQTPISSVSLRTKQKQTQFTSPISKQKVGLKEVAKLETRQVQQLKQPQKLGLAQRSLQLQKQRQILRIRQLLISKQTTTTPRTPIIKTGTGKGIIFPKQLFKPTRAKKRKKGFTVFERRFGKFETIGTGLSLQKAFGVGRGRVSRTLGATFKVEGAGLGLKTPKGFRKKVTDQGVLFIEKRKFRLSRPTEIKEIQLARLR